MRLATLAILAAPAAAQADTLRDPASGLTIDVPPGYAVRAVPPMGGQVARFEVKTPADADTGCQVSFTEAPQNGRLLQLEIDRIIGSSAWQDRAKATLSGLYDIQATAPFPPGGPAGLILVGAIKDRPGLPPQVREVLTMFVIRETPHGRTSVVCTGERAGFEDRQAEFLAVAKGAVPP